MFFCTPPCLPVSDLDWDWPPIVMHVKHASLSGTLSWGHPGLGLLELVRLRRQNPGNQLGNVSILFLCLFYKINFSKYREQWQEQYLVKTSSVCWQTPGLVVLNDLQLSLLHSQPCSCTHPQPPPPQFLVPGIGLSLLCPHPCLRALSILNQLEYVSPSDSGAEHADPCGVWDWLEAWRRLHQKSGIPAGSLRNQASTLK